MTLDQYFTYQLHRLHKLTDAKTQLAYDQEIGLPLSEGRCLSAIGTFGKAAALSINALGHWANITKSQASRAAKALAAKGLVRLDEDTNDARSITVSLTTKGEALNERVLKLAGQRNKEILSKLSVNEQKQLHKLMARLIDSNS
jgi:DNA-binding MarR family transcriptional regulator